MRPWFTGTVLAALFLCGYSASGSEPDDDIPPGDEFPPPVCYWQNLISHALPAAPCGSMGAVTNWAIDDCPCHYGLNQLVNIAPGSIGTWAVRVNGNTIAMGSAGQSFHLAFNVTLACNQTFEYFVGCKPPGGALQIFERQTGSCTGPCDD